MRRRRTPTPGPGRDWRALAAPPAQRELALPVRSGANAAPDAPLADELRDVELRVRRGADGARVALVAAVVFADTDDVRRLAGRLIEAADAADALEGTGS